MIRNKTKKTLIAEDHLVCRSLWSKGRGLMFRRQSFVKEKSLVFSFDDYVKASFHMFFVFFPIDVIFLDEKKRVVESVSGFRPFTVHIPKKNFMYVIEMPEGVVDKSKTKVGDIIDWGGLHE